MEILVICTSVSKRPRYAIFTYLSTELWLYHVSSCHNWEVLGDLLCSVAKSYLTLCDPMDCSTPGFPALHCFPEFAQTHVHWVDAIQPSHPLLTLLFLPSILPSIRVLSNESVLYIRWPKYWSFSFSISPSNEYSGLTSFRIDWFDLLAVQGTLKHLLQHWILKVSILWHSGFFSVQLSHPYMTTGKTVALTIQMVVGRFLQTLWCKMYPGHCSKLLHSGRFSSHTEHWPPHFRLVSRRNGRDTEMTHLLTNIII